LIPVQFLVAGKQEEEEEEEEEEEVIIDMGGNIL
jgi:hypothetical protein